MIQAKDQEMVLVLQPGELFKLYTLNNSGFQCRQSDQNYNVVSHVQLVYALTFVQSTNVSGAYLESDWLGSAVRFERDHSAYGYR